MKRPVPPRRQRGLRGLPRAACPCLSLPALLPVPTELLSHWDGACSPGPILQADFGMFQAASPCREPRSLCARQRCALLLQDMIYHPNSSPAGDRSPQQSGLGDGCGLAQLRDEQLRSHEFFWWARGFLSPLLEHQGSGPSDTPGTPLKHDL